MSKVVVIPFAALSASLFFFAFWQLPTYSGTKSYQNLLVEVYGMQYSNHSIGRTINSDSIVQLLPTAFIRSGAYQYGSSNIVKRSDEGVYWWSAASENIHANGLDFHYNLLEPQYGLTKGSGYSLRCLVPLDHNNRGKLDKSAYVWYNR